MKLAPNWIGLLAIAMAMHGYHKGFAPVYPGDPIALAVVGLLLAYCVRGQQQFPGQQSTGAAVPCEPKA
ncbi:hypothetical protein [Microvirga tunisiensis]|uniref:Uncharacterized protein n=1 Tax=Microvirga tunisiensis TaxID=2108360 RepID=A0A5N7MUM9_9HYPH|nr:hypothetical protein [Microvirga tunisiensis]MPR12790.1 hypothetical protein [Microvirga tunisiensis]MPR30695.1 hypothetical protein [Microvirga tunisiensis]